MAHSHDHAQGHSHAPADFGKAFAVGIALNAGFVVAEAGFGFFSNSTALLADAGHNLTDVVGLLVARGAASLAKRARAGRFTYGLRGSSILAALFNAILSIPEESVAAPARWKIRPSATWVRTCG
jgi:cobalt-zinc-cadmium efflux system protein